jgi:hypothetical protein
MALAQSQSRCFSEFRNETVLILRRFAVKRVGFFEGNEKMLVLAATLSILAVWFVSGVGTYYFYPRVFGGVCALQRDFMVLLGPVGAFMLLLSVCMMGFLNACASASSWFTRN